MNGFTLLIGSAVIFLIAYVVYGSWLAKQWGIDPKRKTPAETQKDGIDYLPTKPAVLLGHHFSSIAGAGPIVGPITRGCFRMGSRHTVDYRRQRLLRRRA